MVQLGFEHQSNGQSDPLSRSWNSVTIGAGIERGDLVLQVLHNQRLRETAPNDDNPDLTDYIGSTEISVRWLPGRATASLGWRISTQNLDRGSADLHITYPVVRGRGDLRGYLRVFSGYGETLLDYNHKQTTVGVGLMLFQF